MVDLKRSLAILFREVFEGMYEGAEGTWFVQGKEAIFDAIESLSPKEASLKVTGQPSSIGAHVWHLCYYLELFNASLRAETSKADWDGSWEHQSFNAKSWQALKERTRKEFEFAMRWYEGEKQPADDGEQATHAAANLAHAAYHLGAIRALMPIVLASK